MEQNGGSCAGERAAGEGGGRGSGATECGAHAGSQGSSPPGAPQAASPPLGEARAAARPAARGLSRLPDRGPPPSPPTRPHASREALEGQSGQLARTAVARGLRAALGEPPTPLPQAGKERTPALTLLRAPPPGHTAGPPRSTKKEPHLANPSLPILSCRLPPHAPESERTPPSAPPSGPLPQPRSVLRSHFPLAQPGGPSTPSSKMGAEALARLPSHPPCHSLGVERPHLPWNTGWRGVCLKPELQGWVPTALGRVLILLQS